MLDPACGSGNFLYGPLEHLKRLEGEVLNQLEALGQTQDRLGLEGETVTLQQLRGIELNERAAALAELVLKPAAPCAGCAPTFKTRPGAPSPPPMHPNKPPLKAWPSQRHRQLAPLTP